MNFLAHSLFADDDELIVVGQYCGDFVRGGKEGLEGLPDAVLEGIRRHRQIDSYTDRHPANLRARNLFEKPLRRFAGIITDVVYDHYLARNWSGYSEKSLESHADFVYGALERHQAVMPPALQRFAQQVVKNRVLESYRGFDAVEFALGRIAMRSPRFEVLAAAGETTRSLDESLNRCFEEFMPDLINYVEEEIKPS